MPFRADTSVDCADDPANWVGADTNATAMAVSALTYAAPDDPGARGTIDAALDWLAGVADADGGWASNSWSAPDANSTAVVIQALITAGKLGAPEFNRGVRTPQQFLMTLQITSPDEPDDVGAFNFMSGPDDPNLLATVQAVAAVASQPLIFEAPLPEDNVGSTTTTSPPSDTDHPQASSPPGDRSGGHIGDRSDAGDRRLSFAG